MTPSSQAVLGLRLLEFAHPSSSKLWMRRRIEEIEVRDDRTISRRVTFHIDVRPVDPEKLPLEHRVGSILAPGSGATFDDHGGNPREVALLVPLGRFDRRFHMVSSIECCGNQLTRPTRVRERQLVEEALRAKWSDPLLSEGTFKLAALALRAHRLAAWVPKPISEVNESETLLLRFCESAAKDGFNEDDVYRLWIDLVRWQRSFLLVAELPSSYLKDGRAVISLAYSSPMPSLYVVHGGRIDFKRLRQRARKIVAGTLSVPFTISVRGAIESAESAHVSVAAPPGFRVVGGRLTYKYDENGTKKTETLWDRDNLPTTAHFTVRTEKRRVLEAQCVASFYAYKTGFFMESLLSSLALFGILLTFYTQISRVGFADLSRLNSNLSAGIVLLLPALVVTLVTQRDSHRVASKCLAIPRLSLIGSVMANVAASLTIALEVRPTTARLVWSVAIWVSGLVALRFVISSWVHAWRISRTRNFISMCSEILQGQRQPEPKGSHE